MKLNIDDKVRVRRYTAMTQPDHWNRDGRMLKYCGKEGIIVAKYNGKYMLDLSDRWAFYEEDLEVVK